MSIKKFYRKIMYIILMLVLMLPLNFNSVQADSAETIFIGDSRTVGMQQAVGTESGTRWISKTGSGYDWFTSNVPSTSSIKSGSKVVILMGVNDLDNVNAYASYINNKAAEWNEKGINTYFVSVNPINDALATQNGYSVRDSKVKNFNNTIKSKLSSNVTYIDTYSKIINSYIATDGLHYSTVTYKSIYNEIKSAIGLSSGENNSSGSSSTTASVELNTNSNKTASNESRAEEGTSTTWDDKMHYTIEDIIYNKVPFFDVNVFSKKAGGQDIEENSVVDIIRTMTSVWYVSFRNLSLVVLIILLIYAGIRLAITTVASEKAHYKDALIGWLKSLILVLSIHLIMIGILKANEKLVSIFENVNQQEGTLYDTLWSRALQKPFGVGVPATIMFVALILIFLRFCFAYIKRLFYVILLIILAPIVIAKYAFGVVSGKRSNMFSEWVKNFASNVMLQSIHAMAYTVLGTVAVDVGTQSFMGMILALFLLRFLLLADDIFLGVFKFNFGSGKPFAELRNSFKAKKEFSELMWIMGTSKKAFGLAKTGLGGANRFMVTQVQSAYTHHMDRKYEKTGETTGIVDKFNEKRDKADNFLINKLSKGNEANTNNKGIRNQAANMLRLRKLSRVKGDTGRQARRAYKLKMNVYKKKFTANFKIVKNTVTKGGEAFLAVPMMVLNPEMGTAFMFNSVANVTGAVTNVKANKEKKEKDKKYNENLDSVITSLAVVDANLDILAEELDKLDEYEKQKTIKQLKKYVKFSSVDLESRIKKFVGDKGIEDLDEGTVTDIVNRAMSGVVLQIGFESLEGLDIEGIKQNAIRTIMNDVNESKRRLKDAQVDDKEAVELENKQNSQEAKTTEQANTGISEQKSERNSSKDNSTEDKNNSDYKKGTDSTYTYIADTITESMGEKIADNKFTKPIDEIQKVNFTEQNKENSNGQVIDINKFLDNL